MVQKKKNLKGMYRKKQKKHFFENFVMKRGGKQKSEKLIKRTLKQLQKTETKKNSWELLKQSLLVSAEAVSVGQQTIKKGKRKTRVPTTIFLISKEARFSKACCNLVKRARDKNGSAYPDRLANVILGTNLGKEPSLTGTIHLIDEKSEVKFKW